MTVTPEVIAKALAAPLEKSNDAGVATVRDYLVLLLRKVWDEGEGFDGKRPFGNSSWESDLEIALVRAGLVHGRLDEDGYLEHADSSGASEIITAAIQSFGAIPAGQAEGEGFIDVIVGVRPEGMQVVRLRADHAVTDMGEITVSSGDKNIAEFPPGTAVGWYRGGFAVDQPNPAGA